MHNFVTELWTRVHISVTKWGIVGVYMMHCGIYGMGLLHGVLDQYGCASSLFSIYSLLFRTKHKMVDFDYIPDFLHLNFNFICEFSYWGLVGANGIQSFTFAFHLESIKHTSNEPFSDVNMALMGFCCWRSHI